MIVIAQWDVYRSAGLRLVKPKEAKLSIGDAWSRDAGRSAAGGEESGVVAMRLSVARQLQASSAGLVLVIAFPAPGSWLTANICASGHPLPIHRYRKSEFPWLPPLPDAGSLDLQAGQWRTWESHSRVESPAAYDSPNTPTARDQSAAGDRTPDRGLYLRRWPVELCIEEHRERGGQHQ